MARQRLTLDLDELGEFAAGLTELQEARVAKLFRKRLIALIRKEAFPVIRRAIPRRTGRLRRGLQATASGNYINIGFRQGLFYWHLQKAANGQPLPRYMDGVIEEVVNRAASGILQAAISEIVSEVSGP